MNAQRSKQLFGSNVIAIDYSWLATNVPHSRINKLNNFFGKINSPIAPILMIFFHDG
jgi:hypothetical protein